MSCLPPVGWLTYFQSLNLDEWIDWCGKSVFLFLVSAVFLLGSGGLEFAPISAWSVSRTTFGFWILWKLAKALRAGRCRADWLFEPIPLALLLFFLAAALSLFPNFHASSDFRYFFFGCAHAVMVMDLFASRSRVRLLLLLLGLAPGFLTVRGLLENPSVLNLDLANRFGFPLDHPNTAGYLFSMSIPLAVVLAITESERWRWLSFASCAAQVLGLVLTYSRGAWLGCVAALLFLLVRSKQWKPLLCVIVAPVLLFIFLAPLRHRVLSLANPEADVALRDRIEVMRDSIQLGLEHPILGVGYGRTRLKQALRNSYQDSPKETKPIWHAHNVYAEIFADTGVMGLTAFLWLLVRTQLEIERRMGGAETGDRVGLLGVQTALVAFAVSGFGDVPFYHHETRIFFFTLLALAFAYIRVKDSSGGRQEAHAILPGI